MHKTELYGSKYLAEKIIIVFQVNSGGEKNAGSVTFCLLHMQISNRLDYHRCFLKLWFDESCKKENNLFRSFTRIKQNYQTTIHLFLRLSLIQCGYKFLIYF